MEIYHMRYIFVINQDGGPRPHHQTSTINRAFAPIKNSSSSTFSIFSPKSKESTTKWKWKWKSEWKLMVFEVSADAGKWINERGYGRRDGTVGWDEGGQLPRWISKLAIIMAQRIRNKRQCQQNIEPEARFVAAPSSPSALSAAACILFQLRN